VSRRLRLAALISGGGRTLLNLADRIEQGTLDATVELVIASRQRVAGVERAADRGLHVEVASPRRYPDPDRRHDAITGWLMEQRIDLVCLCGYLCWFRVDAPFRNRVVNIHPALLPDFGGHGLYGMHVHRAVLAAGRQVSGCTVHIVDEQYDHGPIVLQRTCPVLPDDDAETLAARVFHEECIAYPQVVQWFAEDRVHVSDGKVTSPRD
jgi:formyltetrahydrofolate-dependent phosphoribosylglycinamide formyltransferase